MQPQDYTKQELLDALNLADLDTSMPENERIQAINEIAGMLDELENFKAINLNSLFLKSLIEKS